MTIQMLQTKAVTIIMMIVTALSPARINVWMWIKIYLTLLLNIRLSRLIYLINIINKFKARLEKLTCAR